MQKHVGSQDSKPAAPSSSTRQGPAAQLPSCPATQLSLPQAPRSSPSPHLPLVLSGLDASADTHVLPRPQPQPPLSEEEALLTWPGGLELKNTAEKIHREEEGSRTV